MLPLGCAVVLVDTVFFSALSPLLPGLRETHALGKGQAGLLAGAYALGVLIGSLPGGLLAARIGPKPATLMGVALTALGTLGFGLAGSVRVLTLTRLLGGLGSACSWAAALSWMTQSAPRERRGEVIGLALGAAVAGALAGPLVGAAAAAAGLPRAFGALAAAGVALAVWVAMTPGTPREGLPTVRRLLAALWHPETGAGLALVGLSPLLFSVLGVLVPLELARLAWSPGAIAALFVTTGAVEAAAQPLIGRWSDRAGPAVPTRWGLLAAAVVLLLLPWSPGPWLLALLVQAGGLAFGMPLAPGMALVTAAGERAGLGAAASLGLVNLSWALGYALGAPAGGALAQRAGDGASYLTLAAVCLAAWAFLPALLDRVTRPAEARS